MSDFSDLWASSNPVKSQKPVSHSLGESKSNLTSLSRSSTPDTFNLLASTHSSRPTSRSITPAIQKASIPLSKSSSKNGDAFHGLVSLGSKASAEGNLTMAERAALAERERQQKAKEVNAAFTSQASFWDQFENSTSQTRATSGSNSMDHDFLVEPSSSQQQTATSSNNRDPFWDLDFIVSESATSTVLLASDIDKTSTSSTILASQPSLTDTLGKSKDTSMSANENWDDIIFGDSNKPVDVVKPQPEKTASSPDPHKISNQRNFLQDPSSPPPHILHKIVEMGFSVDQAKTALAATSTGLDVGAALDILLQDADPLLGHSELENRPIANVHRNTQATSEGTSSTGRSSIRQQGLQEHTDKILSQASSIGQSMFNKANALWKEGRDKVVKAYEEQRSTTTETEPKKGRNHPKWMDLESVDLLPDTPAPPEPAEVPLARPPIILSPAALAASNERKSAGTTYFKLGRFAEAENAYSQALEALPASHLLRVPLHNNRALTRLKTGEYKGTIGDTTEVLNLVTLDLGTSWHPKREALIDDQRSLGDAVVKALRRRAEALEGLENWKEASLDWDRLISAGWVNSAFKKDAITALSRCRRMIAGPEPVNKAQSKRLTKPVPVMLNSSIAVTKLRAANEAQEAEEQARHNLKDAIDARLQTWRAGKENNIRALISSLDTILSPSFRWQQVGMAELITTAQVKLRYNKAIARIHPDKLNTNNTTLEERMIANGVFNTLNEAMHAL